MGNVFNEDFQDFLKSINHSKVKYVLVGGYSVIFHGFPRTTGDLDIFVEVSKENYLKIKQAFFEFGLSMFDMTEENFLLNKDLTVFSFGRSPVSIEILKKISGLSFEEVYQNAIDTEIENIPLKIINLKDLIKNKKTSGRAKDINDIENLDNDNQK
ncbi:MAG: nucleotidyltransferase [Bacteroidetes bacterium]|nr:nucleotidyltransferase [Bacteroidota bacterium]